MFSLNQQFLTLGVAAKAAGAKEKQLRNWLDRGLIDLAADDDRTESNYRRFAITDVLQIAVVARLAKYGVTIPDADEIYRETIGGRVRQFRHFKRPPQDALVAMLRPIEICIAHDKGDGPVRFWKSENEARDSNSTDFAVISMQRLMQDVIETLLTMVQPDSTVDG